MLAKHVTILVRRDMAETIPHTVYEHEVEIFNDIHGESNIEHVPSDWPAVEIDTAEEFDRIKGAYGVNESGELYAERVFGRSHKGLEAYAHKPAKKGKAVVEAE